MNQEKIWDFYQNTSSGSFAQSYSRLAFVAGRIKSGARVLNIGVGGLVFEQICEQKGLDIYSLDPSAESIGKLNPQKAKVGYSQDIPFEADFFDAVVMSEVIEHLETDVIVQTLAEVKRVLKPGGLFLGTVPFNENLQESIVVCPKCGEIFHRWGHVQSFTAKRLGDVLAGGGFTVLQLKPKMFITWQSLNIKGKISSALAYVFYILGVKKSGLNLFFECRK